MLVITQDTEKIFTQELELCANQTDSWRCLVFRFSQLEGKPQGWFSNMLDKVSSCLGDNGARAFLFSDDDVCILLKHATQKGFLTLLSQLTVIFSMMPFQDKASLHEVKVDMPVLRDLKNRENSIRKSEPNTGHILKRQSSIDKRHYEEMSSTLAARRARRSAPGILIVEDDPFSLRLVSKTLGQDYSLFTAQDGRSAMESYLLNAPDMIFLDIGLPDTSGLELIDLITEADPLAFIVMLSGNGNRDNVVRAIEKGAKGFVSKPFAREKLFYYIGKNPLIQKKMGGE